MKAFSVGWLFFTFAACAAASSLRAADDAGRVLDCAQKTGQDLKTVRAGFLETRTFKYFPDETDVTTGVLLLRKPLMVIRFEKPAGKTLWADPDRVEIYTPGMGQLERFEKAKGKGSTSYPVSFTVDRQKLEAEYTVTLSAETDGAWTLLLTPKPETEAQRNFQYRTLTLRKPDCLPVRYEFVEPAGDQVVIDLKDPELDGEIKEAETARTYPADVDIVPLNDIGVR